MHRKKQKQSQVQVQVQVGWTSNRYLYKKISQHQAEFDERRLHLYFRLPSFSSSQALLYQVFSKYGNMVVQQITPAQDGLYGCIRYTYPDQCARALREANNMIIDGAPLQLTMMIIGTDSLLMESSESNENSNIDSSSNSNSNSHQPAIDWMNKLAPILVQCVMVFLQLPELACATSTCKFLHQVATPLWSQVPFRLRYEALTEFVKYGVNKDRIRHLSIEIMGDADPALCAAMKWCPDLQSLSVQGRCTNDVLSRLAERLPCLSKLDIRQVVTQHESDKINIPVLQQLYELSVKEEVLVAHQLFQFPFLHTLTCYHSAFLISLGRYCQANCPVLRCVRLYQLPGDRAQFDGSLGGFLEMASLEEMYVDFAEDIAQYYHHDTITGEVEPPSRQCTTSLEEWRDGFPNLTILRVRNGFSDLTEEARAVLDQRWPGWWI